MSSFDTSTATASGMSGSFTGPDLFWRFVVPQGGDWRFTLDTTEPSAVAEWGISCAATFSPTFSFGSPVNFNVNMVAAGVTDIWVRVGSSSGATYMGTLRFEPVCGGMTVAVDAFEENDDCASAAALVPGLYQGLTRWPGDADYYRVMVPPQMELVPNVTTVSGSLNLVRFFDAVSCLEVPGNNGRFRNLTASPIDVVLGLDSTSCSVYDLEVIVRDDECQLLGDDIFEDNDVFASAALVLPGTHPGLNTNSDDTDWYAVDVAPGQWVRFVVDVTSNPSGSSMFSGVRDANMNDVYLAACDSGEGEVLAFYNDGNTSTQAYLWVWGGASGVSCTTCTLRSETSRDATLHWTMFWSRTRAFAVSAARYGLFL